MRRSAALRQAIRIVLPLVDRFLTQRFARHDFDFAALNASPITASFGRRPTEFGPVQTKHMVTEESPEL